MLRRAYQLQEFIDLWIIKHSRNEKIETARIQHNEWQYVLLMKALFDKFYEIILIVSRTSNSSVHLKFRIFDVMFNHIQKIENIFQKNHYFYRDFVFKVCEVANIKLDKYYNRIWEKREIIYNLANILNSSQKLKLYKYWNEKQIDENGDSECDFEKKYKKKFSNYFRKYYAEEESGSSTIFQFTSKNDEIMHSSNAKHINWFEINQQLSYENFYLNNHDKQKYRAVKIFIIYITKKFLMTFQLDNDERIMHRLIQSLFK